MRAWVGVLGGILLSVSGCAIKTAALPMRNWPMAQHAAYYQSPHPYRIAVMRLTDQRPEVERAGMQPPGMFLLVWNRRIGDYYTSDRLFGGEVAQQLTTQVAAYLQAANVYTQVIEVPTSAHGAASIQHLAQEQTADYVLGGQVQHFFGSQHQHFSMFIIPLPFATAAGLQQSQSLPWGQTTIHYWLYEGRGGDLVWQRQLQGSATLSSKYDSMAEAAMTSLADATRQLAEELRQFPPNNN